MTKKKKKKALCFVFYSEMLFSATNILGTRSDMFAFKTIQSLHRLSCLENHHDYVCSPRVWPPTWLSAVKNEGRHDFSVEHRCQGASRNTGSKCSVLGFYFLRRLLCVLPLHNMWKRLLSFLNILIANLISKICVSEQEMHRLVNQTLILLDEWIAFHVSLGLNPFTTYTHRSLYYIHLAGTGFNPFSPLELPSFFVAQI